MTPDPREYTDYADHEAELVAVNETPHHLRCYGTKRIGYENPRIAGGSRECPGCPDCKPVGAVLP